MAEEMKKVLKFTLLGNYNHGHNILRLFYTLVKRTMISSNQHGICKLPHELPNNLRLRTSGN